MVRYIIECIPLCAESSIIVPMATDIPLPKKILVFGATGVIGVYIIQELYNARTSFEKIGLFTSKSTVEKKADEVDGWKEKGVEVIVGDVNSEDDVKRAYEGLFSVLPYTTQRTLPV